MVCRSTSRRDFVIVPVAFEMVEKSSSLFASTRPHSIHHNGQLMHKFIRSCPFPTRYVSTELVHHSSSNPLAHPDITVSDPYDIPFGLSISSAHIPDLGVRAKFTSFPSMATQTEILLFNKYFRIEFGEVCQQTLQYRVRRIVGRVYTKAYCQFFNWVVLSERRSKTFVELGFESFDRSYDRYMRDFFELQRRRDGWLGLRRVVAESGTVSTVASQDQVCFTNI